MYIYNSATYSWLTLYTPCKQAVMGQNQADIGPISGADNGLVLAHNGLFTGRWARCSRTSINSHEGLASTCYVHKSPSKKTRGPSHSQSISSKLKSHAFFFFWNYTLNYHHISQWPLDSGEAKWHHGIWSTSVYFDKKITEIHSKRSMRQ